MAAETSAEAMVPVNLAILKMNIVMLYNTHEVSLPLCTNVCFSRVFSHLEALSFLKCRIY